MSDIKDDIVERLQAFVLTKKHQCNSEVCDEYQCVAYQGGEEIMLLRSRLAEAEKDATRSRHEWQRECEDTDLLLQGMGLCPSEYRSECGSLLLARIRHKMGHIGLRLDETLARLAEAEALIEYLDQCEGCEGWDIALRQRIDAFLKGEKA